MRRPADLRLSRAPAVTFVVAAVAAALLLVLVIGRNRWFLGDEWGFLAQRRAGTVSDVFGGHAEHWVTLPVLEYRVLWNLTGMGSYRPYLAVLVVAHVATAWLLRVVMRRAGVGSWIATLVAAGFLLFGPGAENILWAFQVTFVGAILFGLVQLLLADHDGPVDRRDAGALLAGFAALMCSGVALPMIAAVGLALLVQRGWRAAALQVVPLGVAYGVWLALAAPASIPNPYRRGPRASELADFVWSATRGTFDALAGTSWLAASVAVVLVVGVVVAWTATRPRRRLVLPAALVVAAAVFLLGTARSRWYALAEAGHQGRYVYTLAALVLPAFAVAVDALVRRWRVTAPFLVALVVGAGVVNATSFDQESFGSATYFRGERASVLGAPRTELGERVPGYVRLNPWLPIGWLRAVERRGELPAAPPASPLVARAVAAQLRVAQRPIAPPATRCRTSRSTITVPLTRGERVGFSFAAPPRAGSNFFSQDSVVVTELDGARRPLGSVSFRRDYGATLEATVDSLVLQLRSAEPHQPLVVCTGTERPA